MFGLRSAWWCSPGPAFAWGWGRGGVGVGVMIMIMMMLMMMMMIIIIVFLSWVNCHRTPFVRNGILASVAFVTPSCRNRGWTVPTVTRIGCVWDETLVTVDGFGAAM